MERLSEDDIRDITSIDTHLTDAHFTRLYHGLGMSHAQISREKTIADTRDVSLQAMGVLRAWLSKEGKEFTRRKIIKALTDEHLVEVKEHLEDKWGLDSPVLTGVTDDDIQYISYNTKLEYNGEMRRLFGVLGMSDTEIKNIESSAGRDVGSKSTEILNEWRMKNGGKASRTRIIAAFAECNLGSTLRDLEGRWRLAPRDLPPIKYNHGQEATGDYLDVFTCRKTLKDRYSQTRSGIGFLPGFPKEFPSDEYFVDLKLAKRQEIPTKVKYVPLKTYIDLLSLQDKSGKSLDHVLVSGLAGTGKTTLVSRLAYQWATVCNQPDSLDLENNDDNLKELRRLDLVFALDIRKLKSDMNLLDAIKDQLLHHVSEQALHAYLIANADRCLFLFDGYDELSLQERVLSSEVLFSGKVILTSRPDKVVKIKHNYKGYVHVSLNGFSEEGVSKFVHNFFGDKFSDKGNVQSDGECEISTISERFIKCLCESDTLKSLSHFPLLLAMMCLLYQDQKKLPETISPLFDSVIKYLLRQWKARKTECYDISLDQFKTQITYDVLMVKLGYTAFTGLNDQDSKLIFKDEDFESKEVVQNGCQFGLLSQSSRINGIDPETEVSFIHKTFQEYCAAMFLCSLGNSNTGELECLIHSLDVRDEGMQNVLKFCCGSSVKIAGLVLPCIVYACNKNMDCNDEHWVRGRYDRTGIYQWLPISLLYEVETKFGFHQTLHNTLKPIVTRYYSYPIHNSSHAYEINTLSYFVECRYKDHEHGWLSFVQILYLYVSSSSYFTASKHHIDIMSKLTSLEAVYLRSLEKHENICLESLESCLLQLKEHPSTSRIEFICNEPVTIPITVRTNTDNMYRPIKYDDMYEDTEYGYSDEESRYDYRDGESESDYRDGESGYDYRDEDSGYDRDEESGYDSMDEESGYDFRDGAGESDYDYRNEEIGYDDRVGESDYNYRVGKSGYDYRDEDSGYDYGDVESGSDDRVGESEYDYRDEESEYDYRNDESECDYSNDEIEYCYSEAEETGKKCLDDIIQKVRTRTNWHLEYKTLSLSSLNELRLNESNCLQTISELHKQDLKNDHDFTISHGIELIHKTGNKLIQQEARLDDSTLQQNKQNKVVSSDVNQTIAPHPTLHSRNGQGDKHVDQLPFFITQLSFEKLTIYDCTENSLSKLSDAMKYLGSLKDLYISGSGYSEETTQGETLGPAMAMSKLTNLRSLEVKRIAIGNSMKTMLHGISQAKLNKFCLEDTPMTEESRDVLFGIQTSVSHNANLHHDATMQREVPLLINMQYLTELVISRNKLGSRHAIALSGMLKNMTQLKELDLHCNQICSDGMLALCNSSQYTPNLSRLDFGYNDIGSDGLQAQCDSFQYKTNLTILVLSHNNIGSDGLLTLRNLFKCTPNLSELDLSHNNIGSDGLQTLCNSFHYTPDLSYLSLSDNNIGSDGAEGLAKSFKYISRISYIDLEGNALGVVGIEAIFMNMHHVPNLCGLTISSEVSKKEVNPGSAIDIISGKIKRKWGTGFTVLLESDIGQIRNIIEEIKQ